MAPRISTWDHKSDKDLLLTIIEMGQLKSIMWPEIANKMVAKGYTFTKEACRQHFQKIRREGRNSSSDNDGDQPAPKSTPRKRAAKVLDTFSNASADDDEEELGKVVKKQCIVKTEGMVYEQQTAPIFKMEGFAGNGHPSHPIDLVGDDIYEAEYADYI